MFLKLDDLNYYRISKQNSLPPNFIFNLKTDNKSKIKRFI